MGIIEKLTPKPFVVYFGHDLHSLRTQRKAFVKRCKKLEKEAWSGKNANSQFLNVELFIIL